MSTTPEEPTPALDGLEADPDEHVGEEVAPDHDLDVDAFPDEDEELPQ